MAPGYWGKPTATLDWCEDNYVVTHFIAEFWNTLSNVLMIVPPLVTAVLYIKERIEHRMIACHLSLLSVGIGSWCFHMTLLYSMQLLDELPMIWGSAFLVYAILMVEEPPGKSNNLLKIVLFLYCFTVTVVYIFSNIPVFFQCAYGLLVICMVYSCIKLFRRVKRCNRRLFLAGVVTYGLGFLMWNIDNGFCGSLKNLKYVTGPLAPFFEFHAWWHILAGLGTYLGLIFVGDTRCKVLGQKAALKHLFGFWPYLAFGTDAEGKTSSSTLYQNGTGHLADRLHQNGEPSLLYQNGNVCS